MHIQGWTLPAERYQVLPKAEAAAWAAGTLAASDDHGSKGTKNSCMTMTKPSSKGGEGRYLNVILADLSDNSTHQRVRTNVQVSLLAITTIFPGQRGSVITGESSGRRAPTPPAPGNFIRFSQLIDFFHDEQTFAVFDGFP
jgi:hypothetical protein